MNYDQESQLPPALSINETYLASAASSTTVTITNTVTCLEISAINDGVFFLIGAGTVSTANFHGYVGAGTTRHYNITKGTTAIQVISTSGSVVVITY